MLVIGTVLQGRYRIERVLGRGGMGAVYRARDEVLADKRVAVKELTLGIADPTDHHRAVQQFHQEARLLARLDHPGLVRVTHYFEEEEKHYLVMEFIDGQTLDAVVDNPAVPLPVSTGLDWIDQVAVVLEYLHHHRPPILFRDLKPANIMIDASQRVRLIDFGIARTFDAGATNTFIKGAGTSGFAPLEQYGDKAASTDRRTDIYALGATLYYVLTRTIPPSSFDLATHEGTLVRPSRLNPEVNSRLEAAVLTMMALRKEDRYQTVSAARQAVRLSRESRPSVAPSVAPRFCTACGVPTIPDQATCEGCGTRRS